jgi:phosphatidylserine/phosphatidylglycerophosphate/cardiolipin synthase-like enzyme
VLIAPSAQAATAPSSYTPRTGVFFNDPQGARGEDCLAGCRQPGWQPTDYQQLTLMNQIMNAVNSVPEGSVIRFVAYSFDYQPMADALIAAKKRGVYVKLLIDSHANTPALDSLRKGLGTSKSKSSYITTCKYSCMANKPSFIHSKLYLFSRAGSAKYVAMNSSANPAETGISRSWNNTYTNVGDKTLYDAYVNNFNDMLPDKTNTDYYHTVESLPYKEYFFPRAGSTKKSDTIYNILNDVGCSKTGPTSTVRLTTYFWTSARIYLAEKLSALKTAGCKVEVIYPDGPGSQDTIYSQVTDELRSSAIDTWNTRLYLNKGLYVHNKVILIDGTYQGVANQKLVYATSQNLTLTSLRESNEVMLRIPNIPAAYGAYLNNFQQIKSQSVQIIGSSAAKTTAGVDSTSEKRSSNAPKDNSPDPDE